MREEGGGGHWIAPPESPAVAAALDVCGARGSQFAFAEIDSADIGDDDATFGFEDSAGLGDGELVIGFSGDVVDGQAGDDELEVVVGRSGALFDPVGPDARVVGKGRRPGSPEPFHGLGFHPPHQRESGIQR
jgi:hypothetical protein